MKTLNIAILTKWYIMKQHISLTTFILSLLWKMCPLRMELGEQETKDEMGCGIKNGNDNTEILNLPLKIYKESLVALNKL